jgi:hypothetical protein
MRTQAMDVATAETHWNDAFSHLGPSQAEPDPSRVLEKCHSTKLSAYDAEYVTLAEQLGLPLVTSDKEIVKAFPRLTLTPEAFLRS